MNKIMKKWTPILVCVLMAFTSCVSELDKYYATPDWLKGNSWEVLDKKGNFKLFLSAVERTSYKDLVQGKGIITVMAPTDSAFQVYLTKHNYASVADIPDSTVSKLVGFHSFVLRL
ncbi:MAG: fasciclin domain-containing protein [Paludibacter sp.]